MEENKYQHGQTLGSNSDLLSGKCPTLMFLPLLNNLGQNLIAKTFIFPFIEMSACMSFPILSLKVKKNMKIKIHILNFITSYGWAS